MLTQSSSLIITKERRINIKEFCICNYFNTITNGASASEVHSKTGRAASAICVVSGFLMKVRTPERAHDALTNAKTHTAGASLSLR